MVRLPPGPDLPRAGRRARRRGRARRARSIGPAGPFALARPRRGRSARGGRASRPMGRGPRRARRHRGRRARRPRRPRPSRRDPRPAGPVLRGGRGPRRPRPRSADRTLSYQQAVTLLAAGDHGGATPGGLCPGPGRRPDRPQSPRRTIWPGSVRLPPAPRRRRPRPARPPGCRLANPPAAPRVPMGLPQHARRQCLYSRLWPVSRASRAILGESIAAGRRMATRWTGYPGHGPPPPQPPRRGPPMDGAHLAIAPSPLTPFRPCSSTTRTSCREAEATLARFPDLPDDVFAPAPATAPDHPPGR